MRIIAGSYKRRKLHEVESEHTRSTKDRVKETLFTMISPEYEITRVLDLYAGSGALGLEALSRYNARVTLVEQRREAYSVLEKNIEMLKVSDYTDIYLTDALSFLHTNETQYSLILLDPPYHQSLVDKSLALIQTKGLLQATGLMVSLTHKDDTITVPNTIKIIKKRTVGITTITFYEME